MQYDSSQVGFIWKLKEKLKIKNWKAMQSGTWASTINLAYAKQTIKQIGGIFFKFTFPKPLFFFGN